MDLKKTDHIADIGAGSGYFSSYLPIVSKGKVFAVDIPSNARNYASKKHKGGFENVITVQSTIKNTALKIIQ